MINPTLLRPPVVLQNLDHQVHAQALRESILGSGYNILILTTSRGITYYRCSKGSVPGRRATTGKASDCPFRLRIARGQSRVLDSKHNHGPDPALVTPGVDGCSPWQVPDDLTYTRLRNDKILGLKWDAIVVCSVSSNHGGFANTV